MFYLKFIFGFGRKTLDFDIYIVVPSTKWINKPQRYAISNIQIFASRRDPLDRVCSPINPC